MDVIDCTKSAKRNISKETQAERQSNRDKERRRSENSDDSNSSRRSRTSRGRERDRSRSTRQHKDSTQSTSRHSSSNRSQHKRSKSSHHHSRQHSREQHEGRHADAPQAAPQQQQPSPHQHQPSPQQQQPGGNADAPHTPRAHLYRMQTTPRRVNHSLSPDTRSRRRINYHRWTQAQGMRAAVRRTNEINRRRNEEYLSRANDEGISTQELTKTQKRKLRKRQGAPPAATPIFTWEHTNFTWMAGHRTPGYVLRLHRLFFNTSVSEGSDEPLPEMIREFAIRIVNERVNQLLMELSSLGQHQTYTLRDFINWLANLEQSFRTAFQGQITANNQTATDHDYDQCTRFLCRRLTLTLQRELTDGRRSCLIRLNQRALTPLPLERVNFRGPHAIHLRAYFMGDADYWRHREEFERHLNSLPPASFHDDTGMFDDIQEGHSAQVQRIWEATQNRLQGIEDLFTEVEERDDFRADYELEAYEDMDTDHEGAPEGDQ